MAGRKYRKFYFLELCCQLQEANEINNTHFFSVDSDVKAFVKMFNLVTERAVIQVYLVKN